MKKLLAILMSATIALSIAACGAEKDTNPLGGDPSTWGPGDSTKVEIPDPFVDCETLDEAEEKAGFDMIIPDAINGHDSRKISVIEKELISVIFVNDKDGQICFRKGVGEKDVSGDFTEYAETEQVNMGGTTITLKGSDGKANLAVWTKDGYAYSISSTEGLNKVTMTDLVTAVNDDMEIGGAPSTWGPGNQADVEIPNPYIDCDTLDAAAREAGFELTVPDAVNGAAGRMYRIMTLDGKMLAGAFVAGNMTGIFQPNDPAVLTPGDGIVEVGTLEELSVHVGFEVEELNRLPFEVKEKTYTAYWQELAEVSYTGEDQTATFRKSVGTEDNSGDFSDYISCVYRRRAFDLCRISGTAQSHKLGLTGWKCKFAARHFPILCDKSKLFSPNRNKSIG